MTQLSEGSTAGIHAGSNLVFKDHGSRQPSINRAWVDALAFKANGPTGLYLVHEPTEGAPLPAAQPLEVPNGESAEGSEAHLGTWLFSTAREGLSLGPESSGESPLPEPSQGISPESRAALFRHSTLQQPHRNPYAEFPVRSLPGTALAGR